MHIVHIASELAPVAKVGGLGDVLLGLNRQLLKEGHQIDLFIPKYDGLDLSRIENLKPQEKSFLSSFGKGFHSNLMWEGFVEGLRVHFLDHLSPDLFFKRGTFYGCQDDAERFLYFSCAIMEYLKIRNIKPNVLHLHDWQTAVIPLLQKEMDPRLDISKVPTLLTIHNLSYQGILSKETLEKTGLRGEKWITWNKAEDPERKGHANLLKGGITFANKITTVSPTYAHEILTPIGGSGLDGVLSYQRDKLTGILNGLDFDSWNFETDPFLAKYLKKEENLRATLSPIERKKAFKKILRKTFNLREKEAPIVCSVSRLVPQKGIPLIKRALIRTLEKGGQFVLLGTSPIPEVHQDFHELAQFFKGHRDIHIHLDQDEELAHLIYGGSDMIVVPSLFEPCGLTQMIGLRYGTVPIVRSTGGLADTIEDVDYSPKNPEERTGFRFDFPDERGIDSALDRAISYWMYQKERWQELVHRGMKSDNSWLKPAKSYSKLYEKLASPR